jgi:hypothetical protein
VERELFRLGTKAAPVLLSAPRPTGRPEISLHPDGTRFIATLYRRNADIWLLEGFQQRLGMFQTPWRDHVAD